MNANFKNLCFNGLYALAILVSPVGQLLILPIQLVYATSISPYDSGYNHGCDDTQISEPPDRYINQPEKGTSFHTDEFMNGYNDGFTICLNEIGNNEITDQQSNESNSFVNNTGQVDTPVSSANKSTYTGANENVWTSEDNSVWIIGFGALVFAIAIVALWKLTHRRKRRQYFSSEVKRQILRDQNYKCAICKRSAGLWDYDHIDGDRSNNDSSNCQALCPNCHARKTRGLLKEEKSSRRRIIIPFVFVIIILLIIFVISYLNNA